MSDCNSQCVPIGPSGRGVVSVTDNGDATLTVLYTDGTTNIIPFISGANKIEELLSNEASSDLDLDANFVADTYFQFAGSGYNTIIYTNTSGETKDFIVESITSVGRNATAPSEYGKSQVTTGIFKRDTLAVDTLQSEVDTRIQINQESTLNPGDINPTLYLTTTVSTDKALVTLLDGESVLLKFKTKDASSGHIKKAILHVREK